MKFYDLEWLAEKCGTDNKYEITVKVSAEARRKSEEAVIEKNNLYKNERYISNVLNEIEEDISPISVNYNSDKAKKAADAAAAAVLSEPLPQKAAPDPEPDEPDEPDDSDELEDEEPAAEEVKEAEVKEPEEAQAEEVNE